LALPAAAAGKPDDALHGGAIMLNGKGFPGVAQLVHRRVLKLSK